MLPHLLRRCIVASLVTPNNRLLPLRSLYSASDSPSLASSPLSAISRHRTRRPSRPIPKADPAVPDLARTDLLPTLSTEEGDRDDAATVARLLRTATDSSQLESLLLHSGVAPSAPILSSILGSGDLSSNAILALYRWATPQLASPLLVTFIDRLGKSRAFDSAWSLLLHHAPLPLSAFSSLFRRYARAGMPSAAIRTFCYTRRHPEAVSAEDGASDPFELLIDALCKEGHTKVAAELLDRTRQDATAPPSVRVYNMLLHGWFQSRKLRKAEKLWDQMREKGVSPTVVTYGTLIEGLCRMRRPEQALTLLEEMKTAGIQANPLTCNPIIDALSEDGRFKEALGMLEKFPLYGVSPNISTFNSMVKGFCKRRDLAGASKILKMMIARGIIPSSTTYNYFFRFFSKFGKIEEGMNLYTKMIHSGYSPDRLTYQLLIKMLCEKERLELAVQLIKEMNKNGFDQDLDTSTMLVHLLCRMRRLEEASLEFESMIKRGIVPQYITYRILVRGLKRLGMAEVEINVRNQMNSVIRSTKLPDTFREREKDDVAERRKSILRKAEVMSDVLKTRKDSKKSQKWKSSNETQKWKSSNEIAEFDNEDYQFAIAWSSLEAMQLNALEFRLDSCGSLSEASLHDQTRHSSLRFYEEVDVCWIMVRVIVGGHGLQCARLESTKVSGQTHETGPSYPHLNFTSLPRAQPCFCFNTVPDDAVQWRLERDLNAEVVKGIESVQEVVLSANGTQSGDVLWLIIHLSYEPQEIRDQLPLASNVDQAERCVDPRARDLHQHRTSPISKLHVLSSPIHF
ncbi:hypothetical protein ZIOFF_066802 [Zingiber officinale]|uniref:Pentatricopeptide repeat-containing protein n=1 Tax=Zingiber officinale TaxID=94328 RepID=A0A8J5EZ14_ZINOF|nr:hypothetical protein ZIOFF_066802 [Zingiber officinale]